MKNWPRIALGELVFAHYGKALKQQERIASGQVPVYGSGGLIGTHDQALFDYPSIVIGRKGSAGSVTLLPQAGWVIDTAYYLQLKNAAQVDLHYLFHALQAANLPQDAITTAIPGLNRDTLLKKAIRLPPLAQQQRIAAVLDKIAHLRNLRHQALQLSDEVLSSAFAKMFGDPAGGRWPTGRIRDYIASVAYGTADKAQADGGALPVLRMNNITYTGKWDLRALKYIDLPADKFEQFTVRKGDLLFNRTNSRALVGKTAVYESDEIMAYAGYLVRARINQRADPYYISAWLNSAYGKQVLQGMCKAIVGMANINAQDFQDIALPQPPLALQQQYAALVMAMRAREAKMTRALAMLEQMQSGLWQHWWPPA